MKKMKLLMLGIMMAMGGTALAQDQVTLTANDATDKYAGWTLQLQTPTNIAGWQMELALPEGVTIENEEITVGDATFTWYKGVTLPAGYGSKYKAVGTPTDNGIFLFFIPVAESYSTSDFQIAGTESEACTITLIAENFDGAAAITVTNVCAADADGNSIAGAENTISPVNHPVGDVSRDFKVNASDIQQAINLAKVAGFDEYADLDGDTVVNASDIQQIINIAKQ